MSIANQYGIDWRARKKDRRKEIEQINQESIQKREARKSGTFQLRSETDLLDKFADKCRENGTTSSAALRQFMRTYVEGK